MIRLADKEFVISDKLMKEYGSIYPAIIYGYVNTFDGLEECTEEHLCETLWISQSIQSKWVKQLLKDGYLNAEWRRLHNKRYLEVIG